jgi:crotonobetainyl-CoA:carnitine CoA-transferase CaiB-like acyl-CoA transferase
MTSDRPEHILDGFKVLDFTQVVAGPTVTRLMAEMGAEIIKIEAPGGDPSRRLPFLKNGRSAYFVQQNRGKKSVCLDVKNPKGLELIKALIPHVDVLVENFVLGVIGHLGLGYEVVNAINPRIVMCSVSAFGQSGPLANKPGLDTIAQAYAGVTYMIGDPNGPPSLPMVALGDVSTGVHAACAIGYALLHRERTGRGQYLDIAILDAYYHCHEVNVQIFSASGGAIKPKRSGSQYYAICPIGLFKSKDGYLIIMALEHQWKPLCEAMGRPELATDPRYATNAKRVENMREVVEIIERWLATTENDADAIARLEAYRVPVAPILSIEDTVKHPHHRQRGTVRTIVDRGLGKFDIPGFPLKFSEFPDLLPLEAPYLGEHNQDVLSRYLGYSAEQVRALEADGLLKREQPPWTQ